MINVKKRIILKIAKKEGHYQKNENKIIRVVKTRCVVI